MHIFHRSLQINVGENTSDPCGQLPVHRHQAAGWHPAHSRAVSCRKLPDRPTHDRLLLAALHVPPGLRGEARGDDAGGEAHVHGHEAVHEEQGAVRSTVEEEWLHAGEVVRVLQADHEQSSVRGEARDWGCKTAAGRVRGTARD